MNTLYSCDSCIERWTKNLSHFLCLFFCFFVHIFYFAYKIFICVCCLFNTYWTKQCDANTFWIFFFARDVKTNIYFKNYTRQKQTNLIIHLKLPSYSGKSNVFGFEQSFDCNQIFTTTPKINFYRNKFGIKFKLRLTFQLKYLCMVEIFMYYRLEFLYKAWMFSTVIKQVRVWYYCPSKKALCEISLSSKICRRFI